MHIDAETARGDVLRLHLPRQVVEWTKGQRFLCDVERHERHERHDAAPPKKDATPPPHVALRGVVVRCDATSVLLSIGGLPVLLPRRCVPTETCVVDDVLRIRLTPRTEERKRDRDPTASAPAPSGPSSKTTSSTTTITRRSMRSSTRSRGAS